MIKAIIDKFKGEILERVNKELEADRDKKNGSDALEALKKFDKGLDSIAEVLGYVQPEHYLAALTWFNASIGGRIPADKLPALAQDLAQADEGLRVLDKFVEKGVDYVEKLN